MNKTNRNNRNRPPTMAVVPRGGDTQQDHPTTNRSDRIVRELECRRRSGLSRSTRWRLERADKFPKRRSISPGCTGWLDSELAAWIAAR
jgi:prophage regulatory protein